jgi:hypothetical protein
MKKDGAKLMSKELTAVDVWEMDETKWEDFREASGASFGVGFSQMARGGMEREVLEEGQNVSDSEELSARDGHVVE